MKRLSVIALVFAVFAAQDASATDWFWFGRGADTLWTTKENWSTTSNEYTAATAYPNSKNNTYIYVNTAHSESHSFTITIPASFDGSVFTSLCIYDDESPGAVTIVGEGDTRIKIPSPNTTSIKWSGVDHPMMLTLRNFNLEGYNVTPIYNSCDGNGLFIDNCSYDSTGQNTYLKLPPGNGGKLVIVDSAITNRWVKRPSDTDYGSVTFAVTNSFLSLRSYTISGTNAVVDLCNSTLQVTEASFFGTTSTSTSNNKEEDVPGMKIGFHGCTILWGGTGSNAAVLWTRSAGREFTFEDSELTLIGSGTLASIRGGNSNDVTRIKNSSLYFSASHDDKGTIYLDNSQWVTTNGNTSGTSPVRYVISGASPVLNPGRWQFTANNGQSMVFLDFIVPKGGYSNVPVNFEAYAEDLTKDLWGGYCGNPNPGAISVLPESAATKAAGTIICPLIYRKALKTNLSRCLPTTLPNEKSKFLVTTDYSWEYNEVNGKAESDWTEVAVGYNSNVAGVAVKIVGLKPGLSIFVR